MQSIQIQIMFFKPKCSLLRSDSGLTHTGFSFVISQILVDFLLTYSGIKQGSGPLIHRMWQRLLRRR